MDEQKPVENETPVEKTKAELFAEDPDRFQDMSLVSFAIIRHAESGVLGHYINPGNVGDKVTDVYEEILKIKGFAERKLAAFLDHIELDIARRNAATKTIVKPDGNGSKGPGFIQGLRNMGRKH